MSDIARLIGNEFRLNSVAPPSSLGRFYVKHGACGRGDGVSDRRWKFAAPVGLAVAGFLVVFSADARAAVSDETQFVLNSFSFLVWGPLVMWMCAGFTMLEAGSVRTKNWSDPLKVVQIC